MTENIRELLEELEKRTSGKKLGRAYKKDCSVFGIPGITITRWKFNEWDFCNPKADLPINARGLFTMGDRIVVRGYNKFFNVGEVRATKMDDLRENTLGPYFATVKENGYLVLMSGYKGKLIVTSKHGSGSESDSDDGKNHALVGRQWVLKHLKDAGKSEQEFADYLESHNLTALGECCDDSFEEHVLSYPPSKAGIYLNGLNHNTQIFSTEPPSKVCDIGDRFGFRRTEFVEFPDLEKLMSFLEESQRDGKWHDREVEGFVIRCKRKDPGNGEVRDFFFKYKFEEPYMMYREWREVVYQLLTQGGSAAYMRAKRSKHSESSMKFLAFARTWIARHPELRERLLNHLGIIELRKSFFENMDITEDALLNLDLSTPKWLLVSVATLGCGKSTVSTALSELTNGEWSHRQSDAVAHGKKGRFGSLVSSIAEELSEHDVALLDRNNSGIQERSKVFEAFDELAQSMGYDLRYVCLNFLPDGPTNSARQLTRKRVVERGDNHQTVKLSALTEKGVFSIMSQFEHRFDVVNPQRRPDDAFDLIIDLEPGQSAVNVKRILDSMRSKYPGLSIPQFTDTQIEAAVADARRSEALMGAQADTTVPAVNKIQMGYFAVGIDDASHERLIKVAKQLVSERDAEALEHIVFSDSFHVTLAHTSSHKAQFNKLKRKFASKLNNIEVGRTDLGETLDVELNSLYWNREAMAFHGKVSAYEKRDAHITVGTAEGVPPVRSLTLFDGVAADVKSVKLDEPIVLKNQEMYLWVKKLQS